jgi:uncharacterized membrane protein YphA (DoxX/SURF4 family)
VIVADVARIVLGVVFAVSAATKLAGLRQWQANAAALGVSAVIAAPVPFVEALLGGLLVGGPWTPWPAVASAVLLLAFTVLLGVRLAQGVRPPCACFGAWSARPLGPGHLARNGGLLLLSMIAMWS